MTALAPSERGRALAAGIPGARYVEIPDAAHGVPIEQADRINQLLLDHLTAADATATDVTCSATT